MLSRRFPPDLYVHRKSRSKFYLPVGDRMCAKWEYINKAFKHIFKDVSILYFKIVFLFNSIVITEIKNKYTNLIKLTSKINLIFLDVNLYCHTFQIYVEAVYVI